MCTVNFGGSIELCSNLSTNSSLKVEVQQYTANINLYKSLVSHLPSLLVGLVVGAYCDKHGRKLAIILPCIGMTLQNFALMVRQIELYAGLINEPSVYIISFYYVLEQSNLIGTNLVAFLLHVLIFFKKISQTLSISFVKKIVHLFDIGPKDIILFFRQKHFSHHTTCTSTSTSFYSR